VNLTGEPVELPRPGGLLLSSVPIDEGSGTIRLPADSAAWWAAGSA
jgi:alpha-glucosidase